jgi:hypothetical protein
MWLYCEYKTKENMSKRICMVCLKKFPRQDMAVVGKKRKYFPERGKSLIVDYSKCKKCYNSVSGR